MTEKSNPTPPELDDVATQIGEFIEYWGFKNIHGRIWTHLFLSPEGLDAGELIERLGVSKALVSMSIADLVEYDVIRNVGKPNRSTTCYQTNPDVIAVITNILRKRERRMLSRLSSAVKLLSHLPKAARNNIEISPDRTTLLSEMIQTAETSLDQMLQLSDISMNCWTSFKNCDD